MPPKRKRVEEESEEENEESSNESSSDNDESDSDNESGSGSGSDNESDSDGSSGSDNDDGSDNDSDDDDEEEEEKPKKGAKGKAKPTPKGKAAAKAPKKAAKAVKKKTAKTVRGKKVDDKKKKAKSSKAKSDSSDKPRKIKSMKKLDRLEEARKAYKWWEAPKHAQGINWKYLEHAGIVFAPEYEPHNIPVKYNGKPVALNPIQEELATFYAAMPLDGPQLGNAATKPVFDRNFFEDFREVLGKDHVIQDFDKLDFSDIREHLLLQRNLKKVATDEEKLLRKEAKEATTLKYGYALIDGRLEKMGNFNMEPPGLFRGRGAHPKTGKVKQRCFAESVMINIAESACVPICTQPGHAWESVRHDPTVTWLCGWTENVQSQNKYVMLAASSSFKGQSDLEKYAKAIRLKAHIHKIRADYTAKIRASQKDVASRQLGVAMWVIDQLALRVGGEKGDDEADTVGCCSLRVEHFTFLEPENPDCFELDLEFLGKDSMLFKQRINFAQYGDLGKQVFNNLKQFCAGKKKDMDVFETLDPPKLNAHLSSLMKGLTAKVFRTYNASVTLEKELPSAEELRGLSVQEKVVRYNAANRQVAILCNHQRTVSKATETMFENLQEKLSILQEQYAELITWKEFLSGGAKKKASSSLKKIPLQEDDSAISERIKEQLKRAELQRERAKTQEEKLAAAEAIENAKTADKNEKKRKLLTKHYFKSEPSVESVSNRMEKWQESIRKLEVDIRNRDENKEVALGTSKINYMDPRISVAWCKRCEVPIDKIFARTLRDKFNWAMAVPPDWKFE